jgi:hypothetical protein
MGSFFAKAAEFAGFAAEKEAGTALSKAAKVVENKVLTPGSLIYHATDAPVSSIEELLASKSKVRSTSGAAVYVTTKENAAAYTKNLAGAKMLEGRLSPNFRPLYFNEELSGAVQEQLRKAGIEGSTYGEAMADIRAQGGNIESKVFALQRSIAREGYHGVTGMYPTREVIGIFGNDVLEGINYKDLVSSTAVLNESRDFAAQVGANKAIMKTGEGKSATSMANRNLHSGNRTPRSL